MHFWLAGTLREPPILHERRSLCSSCQHCKTRLSCWPQTPPPGVPLIVQRGIQILLSPQSPKRQALDQAVHPLNLS